MAIFIKKTLIQVLLKLKFGESTLILHVMPYMYPVHTILKKKNPRKNLQFIYCSPDSPIKQPFLYYHRKVNGDIPAL